MKQHSSIRFSVNGREFYWEGTDEAEGSRKLNEFMAGVFAPLKNAMARTNWRETLGIKSQRCTLRQVEQRFRTLARKHHPDKGGDRNKFEEIVQAREAARLELAS